MKRKELTEAFKLVSTVYIVFCRPIFILRSIYMNVFCQPTKQMMHMTLCDNTGRVRHMGLCHYPSSCVLLCFLRIYNNITLGTEG